MITIKATTTEGAEFALLLHQSKQSEAALAKHVVALAKKLNSITASKVEAERAMEEATKLIDILTGQRNEAERKLRNLKAMRYSTRKFSGVTA